MGSRLKPLSISMDFQEGPYRLGETVRLRIDLEPTRDVVVREGRVDLVCEESYTETFTMMVPIRGSSGGGPTGTGASQSSVTQHKTKKHKVSYVHSSVVFLQDTRLSSGSATTHDVRLEIQPEPPPRAAEAKLKWTLVTSVDVARARDAKVQRAVSVKLD